MLNVRDASRRSDSIEWKPPAPERVARNDLPFEDLANREQRALEDVIEEIKDWVRISAVGACPARLRAPIELFRPRPAWSRPLN